MLKACGLLLVIGVASGLSTRLFGQVHFSQLRQPAAPVYDVVALRVEFQPDTTRFTTGTGTFDGALFDTLDVSIDPLPHNAAYFNAHLKFLEDYVRRVSDGQTTVKTHLVPEVVRLPHPMGRYSPTGPNAESSDEQQKLGQLVADAWKAASQKSMFDMGRFDPAHTALVLFHAGAGRDIQLVGSALNNTPEDIPSIFIDSDTLDEFLQAPVQFNGFPVTHSLIVPETESRLGINPITREPFVAEFSINGMLAASFFNYLGAPDLFNTKTGDSAIGPFGLMDPLGIFAYNGLFPPEPTAWTKYFLGWIDPPTVELDQAQMLNLTAVADTTRSEALLVPISQGEYFLVENRNRDIENDGLRLRVWKDNQYVTQHISASDTTFGRFSPQGFIGGTVAGVDNYDWALPGGRTEEGDPLNGGLAIWHIDERVLAEKLPSNTVNADPQRRAIDLEEADGAQDIGETPETIFGTGSEQGTPFDLFFRGNPVRVVTPSGEEVRLYDNRFGPETLPSSANNQGGFSFVQLTEFSEPGRQMSLRAGLASAADLQLQPAFQTVDLPAVFGQGAGVMSAADSTVYLFSSLSEKSSKVFQVVPTSGDSAAVEKVADGLGFKPVAFGQQLAVLAPANNSTDNWQLVLSDSTTVQPPVAGSRPVAAPVVLESADGPVLYVLAATERSQMLLRFSEGQAPEVVDRSLPVGSLTLAKAGKERLAVIGQTQTVIVNGDKQWSYQLGSNAAVQNAAFGRDQGGLVGVFADTTNGELYILGSDGKTRKIDVGRSFSGLPVLTHLNSDNRLEILVTREKQLIGYSQAGAVVEGFPIELPASVQGQPLVAETEGQPFVTIIAAATNGYVYAYHLGKKRPLVDGFPLSAGQTIAATPLLKDKTLYVVGREGHLKAWRIDALGRTRWGQLHKNALNHSFTPKRGGLPMPGYPQPTAGLLQPESFYNWPNPVREGQTHIRFVPTRPCRVTVAITDMAGMPVKTFNVGEVTGGVAQEVTWETQAASGIYYARIKATSSKSQTETQMITIAVVR